MAHGTHGRGSEGGTGEWSGYRVLSQYFWTWCIQCY